MFKVGLLLALAGSSLALNCAECIDEMHGLNFIIKQGAPEIMVSIGRNCRYTVLSLVEPYSAGTKV